MNSRLPSSRGQVLRGMMGDGDGSPPSRGQREGERMNSRLLSSRGQVLRGGMGTGMGPRLREDNGRGRGWVPAYVFAREQDLRGDGDGDGSPPSRGQREGERMNSRLPSSRGQVLRGMGMGMGPRLREDNGRGRDEFPPTVSRGGSPRERVGGPRLREDNGRGNSRLLSSRGQVLRGTTGGGWGLRGGSSRDDGDGSPPSRGQREGEGVRGGGVPSPGKTLSWQPLPFSSRGSRCNPLLAGRSGRRRAPRWPRRIRLRTS